MDNATIFVDGDPDRAERLRATQVEHGHTVIDADTVKNLGGKGLHAVVLGPDYAGAEDGSLSAFDAADLWYGRFADVVVINTSGDVVTGGDYTLADDAEDAEILGIVRRI